MKTTYLKNKWMHFTLALSLLAALAPLADAESFSVRVPFPFIAGGKSLPAGTYTMDPIASGVLVIRGDSGADSAAVATSPSTSTGAPAKPSLSFDRTPDLTVLSSVRMDSGLTFTLVPAKRLSATIAVPAKVGVALVHP
jgi:hypothetical protein